ncbi:MAG: nucleotidyltransferase family protein [Nanoarchaeota archaeon]|nr:nucleotidyltransferase family protein [Nanoarchaeota archaeon]
MKKKFEKNIKIINKYFGFIQEVYNVKKIGIFGSVVRGQQKRCSDIDILIELSKPMGFFEFLELEDFLSKILKKKVDLVTKNALKPVMKKDILKEVIYV